MGGRGRGNKDVRIKEEKKVFDYYHLAVFFRMVFFSVIKL